MDIAAEELSHMEMVAQTINLLNGHEVEADQVQAGEIETHVLLGLNPGLINASGYSWTADYVTVTGDLCADLLSNIASEQRAKVAQLLSSNIHKQVLDLCILDAEALGHILHGRFQLSISTAQLFLQQCCILWIWTLHLDRMEQQFFVLKQAHHPFHLVGVSFPQFWKAMHIGRPSFRARPRASKR